MPESRPRTRGVDAGVRRTRYESAVTAERLAAVVPGIARLPAEIGGRSAHLEFLTLGTAIAGS
jgi:hypothetical protein